MPSFGLCESGRAGLEPMYVGPEKISSDRAWAEDIGPLRPLLDRCDGKSVFNAIEDILLRLDINLRNCFGMTFDGASSFSNVVGVGARIQEIAT